MSETETDLVIIQMKAFLVAFSNAPSPRARWLVANELMEYLVVNRDWLKDCDLPSATVHKKLKEFMNDPTLTIDEGDRCALYYVKIDGPDDEEMRARAERYLRAHADNIAQNMETDGKP
jgi:hypothetical protein